VVWPGGLTCWTGGPECVSMEVMTVHWLLAKHSASHVETCTAKEQHV
jgi:hypothetical protein